MKLDLRLYYLTSISMILLMLTSFSFQAFAQVEPVRVEKINGQWELLVNEQPFYVKGGGGQTHLDVLLEAGGNTIRTWGTENAQEILDLAHEKGLKVMMGLWVQHERHGFDYNNEAKIKNQLENFRREVRKYKDHPALLLWGVGNEYELNYSNTKVWKAVNDIAQMIQEEDPNHPTCTVTAGTNADKLSFVMKQLPAIDIYGINTYGDIGNVKEVLKKGNFDGPYMITEWGPTGHWESPKTMWGVAIEQTSSEKAESYYHRYSEFIAKERKQCIGSFAFIWGQKQEYTSTWYGLFTEDGMPTEAIDELQYLWSGSYPENRCPTITKVEWQGQENIKNIIAEAGSKHVIEVFANDANGDRLNYRWELYPESTDKKTGGDAENKPPIILGKIRGGKSESISLKIPFEEGRYRLYLTVDDGQKAAYLNIPFYAEPAPKSAERIHVIPQELEPYR